MPRPRNILSACSTKERISCCWAQVLLIKHVAEQTNWMLLKLSLHCNMQSIYFKAHCSLTFAVTQHGGRHAIQTAVAASYCTDSTELVNQGLFSESSESFINC